MKKKIIILSAVCVVLAGANGVAAAAHGQNTAVCTVKACTKTGSHQHNSKLYGSHKAEGRHNNHNNAAGHGKNHH